VYRCEFCHHIQLLDLEGHTTIEQKNAAITALFDLADRVTRLHRAYGRRHGRYRG
jgi:hypothetical protein